MATPTTVTNSVTLQPGETFNLPSGATLVFASDSASLTSSCVEIPTGTYKCGYFYLIIDNPGGSGESLSETSTFYNSVQVGTTNFDMGGDIHVIESDDATEEAVLNATISNQALFLFTEVLKNELADRQSLNIFFRVPEEFFDDTRLEILNWGMPFWLEPTEVDCGVYPDPE